MNALRYAFARFCEARAERAWATAARLEAKAEKIFRSLGIDPRSRH